MSDNKMSKSDFSKMIKKSKDVDEFCDTLASADSLPVSVISRVVLSLLRVRLVVRGTAWSILTLRLAGALMGMVMAPTLKRTMTSMLTNWTRLVLV